MAAPTKESNVKQTKTKKLTTSQRLELVLTTQEERAVAYTKWEQTFRGLLNEEIADEKYLEVVKELMGKFQSVSTRMKEIAAAFDERNLKKLSKFVRNLQEFEKQKMQITMDMQQKILLARPDKHECKHEHNNTSGHNKHENNSNLQLWRPRLYKEKQQFAECIENINDLLAEIKELKNDLRGAQQIIINGTTIQIQTSDDCKTKEIKNQ